MGTYTTNYNLFLPSIGEQGWGDLVNGNFTTMDTTMKRLDTRVGTLETEMDTVEERVTISEEKITVLEAGKFESITADLSPCFDVITDTTNEIGSIRFVTNVTLVNGGNTRVSKTYTYRTNPFNNTVIFTCYAINQSNSDSGDASVKVNDIVVCNAAIHGNTTQTKTATVTLNEGDVIHATAYSRTANSYVRMDNNIYVINS